MGIKIESIQIQKQGPLRSIQLDLGMLNLVYGHNESGKTYLTEFLLHSIFRHAKTWNLRDINPEGSVNLHGLGEQTTNFPHPIRKKIEDYWSENDRGLPLNMARLLVVKGGELALSAGVPGGVDREILKKCIDKSSAFGPDKRQHSTYCSEGADHRAKISQEKTRARSMI